MKIWIDFINTPQVSFFSLLVKALQSGGHDFLFTCRDSGNTVSLAKKQGWNVLVVGEKAEKSTFRKLFAFPSRILRLRKVVKKFNPDIAVGQSSFYLPLTAYLLGVPSIYTNDNEHAMGNIPSFLFATKILISEYMPLDKVKKQGAVRRKIVRYPGVKEGVYLWKEGKLINEQRTRSKCHIIYLRPEPTTAQYYTGGNNFLDDILETMQDRYQFIVLPRDNAQAQHYQLKRFSRITVAEHPLKFEEIALDCKLFIGAGGSMTREMAIIGVPSISVYQDELLGVDKFLVSLGLLKHEPQLTVVKLLKYLNNEHHCGNADSTLMQKGKEAFELFEKEILTTK